MGKSPPASLTGGITILKTTPESEATGLTAEFYNDDLGSFGYVASQTKAMAINPEAFQAFESMLHFITASMDLRRYELITLAAAQAIGSPHCRLAHGVKALKAFPEDELGAVARDFHTAGLEPAEVAMMEYAEKLSRDATAMTDADTLELRNHGFTDREIMDITLAATARNFLSRTLLALAVDVDVPPTLSPKLKDALLAPLSARHPM
ncbi:carboxymuconolactone decarboxylase family protein [Pseudarthrobacter psychrotolerans]|uniref:Carboxymuconolactone decarboxylase family protein n=1 Tax=Pseudarthrobacter psychrotolerans TaxID=2697569 RepID=A0A6P1NL96_9MICC|nr:carboxymuconolactone decarboxylase family protein [Pseudarthrobacter psychrotolerans]QHK20098.1 carboxymuconolactone decarboxylase family protein [Pseudarthrobacter psychrotolerans]